MLNGVLNSIDIGVHIEKFKKNKGKEKSKHSNNENQGMEFFNLDKHKEFINNLYTNIPKISNIT